MAVSDESSPEASEDVGSWASGGSSYGRSAPLSVGPDAVSADPSEVP